MGNFRHKAKWPLLAIVLTVSSLFTARVIAQVLISDLAFSDENLATCVAQTASDNSWVSVQDMTSLICPFAEIASADGIGELTALTILNLFNNQLASIDVSANTALTVLNLDGNQLTNIDVSANTALTDLLLLRNRLTELNINSNTALTYLNLFNNQLTEIDVGVNTTLTYLNVQRNKLAYVDISTNTALKDLYLSRNQLAEIYVSNNKALEFLGLDNNQLTRIDVGNNTALEFLDLDFNQLTEIDVSTNTVLESLHLDSNQLTEIDVGVNTALTYLNLHNNELAEIDVGTNTALTYLNLQSNQLTELDVSANTVLTDLNLGSNQLTDIDVSANTALTLLWLPRNQLTEIDVGVNTALTDLNLHNNQLAEIDVGTNTTLTYLNLQSNQLTELDVSANTALTDLTLGGNQLTNIDVSASTALTFLLLPIENDAYYDATKGLSTVDSDLSIDIPVVRVGSDYYQVGLSYMSPNWQVSRASDANSSGSISATYNDGTLTLNCVVYLDVEYGVTMNLIDAATSTFSLGSAAENPGCSPGTSTLSGIIRDSDNDNPLENALVELRIATEPSMYIETGFAGTFSFTGARGTLSLVVKHDGYADLSLDLDVSNDKSAQLYLQRDMGRSVPCGDAPDIGSRAFPLLSRPFDGEFSVGPFYDHGPDTIDDGNILTFCGEFVRHDDTEHSFEGHRAYDWVNMPDGTPLLATFDGTVTVAGTSEQPCANPENSPQKNVFIVSDSNPPFEAFYAHLDRVDVVEGQHVTSGQVIGLAGTTSCDNVSPRAHLHFAVCVFLEPGLPEDPQLIARTRCDPVDPYGWEARIPDPMVQEGGVESVWLWRPGEAPLWLPHNP